MLGWQLSAGLTRVWSLLPTEYRAEKSWTAPNEITLALISIIFHPLENWLMLFPVMKTDIQEKVEKHSL